MKEFLVGLIFLIAVAVLSAIGFFIYPLLIALAWFLRIIIVLVLGVFAIWLLGKFIIVVWEKLKG
jgi:hypothetical protein